MLYLHLQGPMAVHNTLEYLENATKATAKRKKTGKSEPFQPIVNVFEVS